MKYMISPNVVTAINETSGTIQNRDQINTVELSNTVDFIDTILLYPYQKLTFNGQLYVRSYNNSDLPVELSVVTFSVGGGTSGTSISDEDFTSMLNEVGI